MELIGVLMLLLLAALVVMPKWPYSVRWGYVPSCACGLVALLMAALVVVGFL